MKQAPINVTKAYLPPIEEYEEYVSRIWKNGWLTNQGPLLKEFEDKAAGYLGVSNFQFVSNGTIALQLALRALDITEGEVITSPFTYVATTSAILWERCTPVFVDIDPQSLCMDPTKIEAAITPRTKAIMPVHVFGIPCNVEAIGSIARKHNLWVIYDAAHAFGVTYRGKSLLDHGDISICSFHATKLFHTIEGGCLVIQSDSVSEKADLLKRFGHNGDDHIMPGINGKASEFQAAMGLVNLTHIKEVIEKRKQVTELYDATLNASIERPKVPEGVLRNFAYYPIILKNEAELKRVGQHLNESGIFPRRYFYPSLNKLPYLKVTTSCPISEDIASRILCLPLYDSIEKNEVNEICEVIAKCMEQ